VSIHPSAIVSSGAQIGANVSIGPFTVVHAGARIGSGTSIGSHCEIALPSPSGDGSPLLIGDGSLIRSHSIFYESSSFGPGLVTGHRVTVRERTRAGRQLQIGTLSDIQGHCEFGECVRLHSSVHIGQASRMGSFVWIFPYVVLTNDPHPPSSVMRGVTIDDFAAIATMSVVLPGVRIGQGALVGAHSSVSHDVEPDTVVVGAPAKRVCLTSEIKLRDGTGRPAYPWRHHFTRGYPEDAVKAWLAEAERLGFDSSAISNKS
jgi:acyl-[acyl carrier protein]--UDP-N-acetylglucosamine O-acyltransferase